MIYFTGLRFGIKIIRIWLGNFPNSDSDLDPTYSRLKTCKKKHLFVNNLKKKPKIIPTVNETTVNP